MLPKKVEAKRDDVNSKTKITVFDNIKKILCSQTLRINRNRYQQ